MTILVKQIEAMIYILRGQRVMLDSEKPKSSLNR
jgi:hypothetical protein